jgi:hypothetical protein
MRVLHHDSVLGYLPRRVAEIGWEFALHKYCHASTAECHCTATSAKNAAGTNESRHTVSTGGPANGLGMAAIPSPVGGNDADHER